MTASTSGTTTSSCRARHVRRLNVSDSVRPVRVVHALDGIDHQVAPVALFSVGRELWRRWQAHPDYRDHDVILGLDAGGILPTVAVALASRTAYRLAWKLDLDLPDKHVFLEPHANRTEVFTYGSLAGQRVLVVDDEITTGATMANLVEVLRVGGADIVGVACLVEDTGGHGRERLASLDIPLCALTVL